MKSKTTRTDNACETCDDNRFSKSEVVNADFARNLELELNAALETIETQREHIAELKSKTVAAMPNEKS
jgi:hypothetical protein